jgi:enediyne biosynthesis protein E4
MMSASYSSKSAIINDMRRASCLLLCALTATAACGDNSTQGTSSSSSTGGAGGVGGTTSTGGMGGSAGGPVCGSANLPLPEIALEELGYDDGVAAATMRDQDWQISLSASQTYVLNDENVHEAMRFALDHPATIYAVEVMWGPLIEGVDPAAELPLGIYSDFGHNGFDFWAADPLWTGTRCAADVDDTGSSFTRYVLDEPITVDHPGLVYVAHLAAPGAPVWWFDGSQDGPEENPCGAFDDCRGALNLPEAATNTFFNGLSFSFQYDYMVRLLVTYDDAVQPADTFFQPVAGAPSAGHVSWADYDEDGFDDLLAGNALWHNDGDGSFSDVTVAAGLDGLTATGGVWGDYDNDGCIDLFLFAETPAAGDLLMQGQCDGTFVDATASAGIIDDQSYEDCNDAANTFSPTAAAAWVDIDADGFLDLYQANFICWAKETYYVDSVWHNQGDGSFLPLGLAEGFGTAQQPSRCVAPIDHDNDGDVDIQVGNYRLRPNQFYDNGGDGSVLEQASASGLAGTFASSYYGHTIGLAWGDIDNDGDFDQIAANLAHPRFFDFSDKTQVLINDGSGQFTDLGGDWLTPTSGAGLRYQETHSVPVLADANLDGNLDLAITCVYDGRPTDFYWGNGDGTFTLDAYHAGITTEDGWGIAAADFDNDGDPDIFADGLFENRLADADKGHWIQVKVVGVTANRSALGATVRVTADGQTTMRHVQGGSGKGGQDSRYLSFGLGTGTSVDAISVTFPGGAVVTYSGPIAVDQRVWLYQDSTTPISSWGKPN